MHIKKALKLLRKGEKITHDSWGKDFYLVNRVAKFSHRAEETDKFIRIYKEEDLINLFTDQSDVNYKLECDREWRLWEIPVDYKIISSQIAELEQLKIDIQSQINKLKKQY